MVQEKAIHMLAQLPNFKAQIRDGGIDLGTPHREGVVGESHGLLQGVESVILATFAFAETHLPLGVEISKALLQLIENQLGIRIHLTVAVLETEL